MPGRARTHGRGKAKLGYAGSVDNWSGKYIPLQFNFPEIFRHKKSLLTFIAI